MIHQIAIFKIKVTIHTKK